MGDVEADPEVSPDRRPRRTENEVENGKATIEDERAPGSSQSPSKAEHVANGVNDEEKKKKKPSKLKVLWGKLGLDLGTVLMMFKWVPFLTA